MIVAAGISIAAYLGAFGPVLAALAPFVSLAIALVLPPLLAVATRGAFSLARTSEFPPGTTEATCAVCEGTYDLVDMATCPFHAGAICSLCCSVEASCHDSCKPHPWLPRPGGPVALGLPAVGVPAPTGVTATPAVTATPVTTAPEVAR
jgi:hypothetical protein